MAPIINRGDTPSHLFAIPELDFAADLFTERVGGLWFRLGAWTITHHRDERGVEDVLSRQSFLLSPHQFAESFDNLDSVGNVIDSLGKPQRLVHHRGEEPEYNYAPFHQFEVPFASAVGEPVVFVRSTTSGVRLFINPDLWLFFELEEKARGSGIWWDPRCGVDALRQRVIDQDNLEVVEIQIDYLLRYLQARQMSLIVGHYRHLHLFDPPRSAVEAFVKGDVVLGSPEQGVKAILQNWGLRQGITGSTEFLQRRLHLWLEIAPPEIDTNDPWADHPSFDPYIFTLPTRVGPVAPARWKHFRHTEGRTFEGEVCDFMARIYFRPEVLTKYEGAAGFDVGDDGSVSCRHYWGLVRGTARIGNELLATAIGDFAEGVPFEEWPHWKQHAVEPPSTETTEALREEQSVPDAVNSVVNALKALNTAFAEMAASLGLEALDTVWCGSLDSLAGRQLKWVYPATADDDEFLKRATLVSTLVIEALQPAPLRRMLLAVGSNLHMSDESPPQFLGSRNLLQRLTLVAVLIRDLQPNIAELPMLIRQAEGKAKNAGEPDLQAELEISYRRIRDEFTPLAFLYELRNVSGLAHVPNKERVAAVAAKLHLPEKNWHRTDYLHLLNLITDSVYQISRHLDTAAQVISGGLSEVD